MKSDSDVVNIEVIEETSLATVDQGETVLSVELIEDVSRAAGKAKHARSDATRKAYDFDWAHFTAYCERVGAHTLPAEPSTVVAYLSRCDDDGYKVSTLQRRLSAISVRHRLAALASPTAHPIVSEVWEGIRRENGTAPEAKTAAVGPVLRQFLDTINPNSLKGMRDRALLLVGFFGAFRRSELVALNIEDLEYTEEGVTVKIQRSKTDQRGEGAYKAIPYRANPAGCPVTALKRWIEVAGIESGPLFKSVRKGGAVVNDRRLIGRDVARIVKAAAEGAGLDPAAFSGHSLRSGFATTAARAGASDRSIMQQTGHKSRAMVDRYVQAARVWEDNAADVVSV